MFDRPHLVERRTDFAGLSHNRRVTFSFIRNTLLGPRLVGLDGPTLIFVPDEDMYKTVAALNCPLLDATHLADCSVLFVHSLPDPEVGRLLPGRRELKADIVNGALSLSPVAPLAGADAETSRGS